MCIYTYREQKSTDIVIMELKVIYELAIILI